MRLTLGATLRNMHLFPAARSGAVARLNLHLASQRSPRNPCSRRRVAALRGGCEIPARYGTRHQRHPKLTQSTRTPQITRH